MSIIWLTRGLLVLILFSVLNCCTSQKMHSQSKLQKLPVSVEPETAAVVPESPSVVVSPSPIPKARFYVHSVRWKGETLFTIAKWYTGSGKNWQALSSANPKFNPDRIFINDKIFIPEDLMKNRKPMPLSFVPSFSRKKNVQSFQSNKPSNENDVTDIFGPIESDLDFIESDTIELFKPIE